MRTSTPFLLLPFLIFLSGNAFSQSISRSVIANLGHFYSNGSGSLSATLGEPMTKTFSSSQNELTQGFQQSSFRFTSVDHYEEKKDGIHLFPNPVDEGYVRIRSEKGFPRNTVLKVHNLQGKIIDRRTLQGHEERLRLGNLSSGSYIFRIMAPERILGTYRVEKVR